MTLPEFRDLLAARECKPTGQGTLSARCPAHDDGRASLSVSEGDDGRLLVHCHAGCDAGAIVTALGLKLGDLFTDKPHRNGSGKLSITATYPYHAEDGALLFEVVRFEPKDFRQRAPDGKGGWTWSTKGVRRVPFRLPQVLAAIEAGVPVYVVEGEKDALRLVEAGFCATCNAGGAGKWLPGFDRYFEGAEVCVVADRDEPGRKHAQQVAASLHGAAASVRVLELPDVDGRSVKDAADFFAAGGGAADFFELASAAIAGNLESVTTVTPSSERTTRPLAATDDLQRAIRDARPKVLLPGNDRLISDFAVELAEHLRERDIYVRNGEVVILQGGELRPISPPAFRTWVESHVIGYRAKTIGDNSFEVDVTMRDEEARAVLASPQFLEGLRRVLRLSNARLPFIGADGALNILPHGYHAATQTLTLNACDFATDIELPAAIAILDDLFSEFAFADTGSKSICIGAMAGLFAVLLVPEKSLRPCFVFLANAEGAGKTLAAQSCIVPTLGAAPVGSSPDDDDEMRKILLAAVREGRAVLFLDNLKGHLSSAPLEGFLSAPEWSGRKLGVSESVTAPNLATVFVTGNGLTVSPDMRRRSLFVELHLEAERAEDRQFKRPLDVPALVGMRPRLLAALWAMVRHWDANGRPGPSRGHTAFPSWAQIVGGIVEAAGFACPFHSGAATAAVDQDGDDMRALVQAMATDGERAWTFAELAGLARGNGLFAGIVGSAEDGEIGRREKSTLARLFARYDRRLVKDFRFIVEGKGHARRYRVMHGLHGSHGVPGPSGNSLHARIDPYPHADRADHAADLPETPDLLNGWPTGKPEGEL